MSSRHARFVSSSDDDATVDLKAGGVSKSVEDPLTAPRGTGKRSVIDFVLRNRIHLLPAAALIAWATPPLYGSTPSWDALPSVLLAGFGIYELNRVFDVVEDKINDPDAYAHTRATRTLILKIAISATFASIVLSLLLTNLAATITLLIVILAGVLYSVPFLGEKRGRIRLKQIPSLKNVVPSIVWPFTTIVYPAMFSHEVHLLQLLLAVIGVSCAVFTIEVAWDIRDSYGDQIAGIRTLATAFRSRRALLVPLFASCSNALVIVPLVYSGNLAKLWLLPALFLVLLPTIAYLWKDSLVTNRDRSHLLVLMNMLALILLGIVGHWERIG